MTQRMQEWHVACWRFSIGMAAVTSSLDLDGHNFSREEELVEVRRQFLDCHALFRAQAFEATEPGLPLSCRLHQALQLGRADHNCLGCNFAEVVELIDAFLKTHVLFERLHHSYIQHLLLQYLLVARIEELFDAVALDSGYRKEHFAVLVEVRRWANFIKHPKTFLLTHHAEFTFDGSPRNTALFAHAQITIDRSFLDAHYTEAGREPPLANKDRVLVLFPHAVTVTRRMCDALQHCVRLVENNEVYRWVLHRRSTFVGYAGDQNQQ